MTPTRAQLAQLASDLPPSDLRAAGWTPSDLIAAGWTPSDLIVAGVPILERPYSRMVADIHAHKRIHKQSTFGPGKVLEVNICNTPMCTAGHLVNMAGDAGWALRQKYGWEGAARLIHYAAHPEWPAQNFGAIPDEWAMAFIEEMEDREEKEAA